MDKFGKITGRQYHLFDYAGHKEPERLLVIMGSGGETAETTVSFLAAKGEKVGVVVRLPAILERTSSRSDPHVREGIAVLDAQEPGTIGDPFLDVVNAHGEGGLGIRQEGDTGS
jgi:pyruvate-ferredoxin/flavodoxin oxidoreductase